ncbi:MAG: hypothetical protein Q7J84_18970 [Sulfuricaulis sp.]|nr:hypothetical protein [Sulfuricaulis sp.]
MAKPPTKAQVEEATRLQGYLDAIAKYEREFKKWEERNRKILKRYRDEGRDNTRTDGGSKFNILWSNVQILVPATFAKVPQPDVSRRFRDQDPVGRVAALILERGLEFEVQHYPDYRETMTQDVHDRFLGGRGTCWVRYEPHFKPGVPPEAQVTEDVEAAAPEEQLDYECAPVDYVHWKDFGHSVARTWEEVTCVWRKVYMSEAAVEERFGEDIAKKIPYDSTPEDLKRADRNSQTDAKQQACVIELWDKEAGIAVWFSKSMKEFLDELPDPLKLQQFFPCPKPLYATLTNDTLVPVPDFTLYQDQAITLDTLADRIAGLVDMLQVKGTHDASIPELARVFTEGKNGTLLPVKNYAAYAEKGGLKGTIDVLDLTPIAKALEVAYLAAENVKAQVYEIMGISDIVRGASDPNETLGAQELKGQYASMRLRAMQADVARYATDVLQLKAQVMCSKFAPQTLIAISAAEQLSPEDQQAVPQALSLLVGMERMQDPKAESPNPLRSFRIEVASDSMIQMNEAQEKKDRMEFLTAFGTYLEKASQVGAVAPQMAPLLIEVGKFGIAAFKAGKQIEGTFDAALDQLKAQGNQTPPDPKAMQEQAMMQAKAQVAQENATKEIGLTKRAADLDIREMKFGAEQELAKARADVQGQIDEQGRTIAQADIEHKRKSADQEKQQAEQGIKIKQERASFDEERATHAQKTLDKTDKDTKGRDEALQNLVAEVSKQNRETSEALAALVKAIGAKKRIVRNPQTGRAEGVESVQ